MPTRRDVLLVAYDIDTRGVQDQIAHSRGMLGMALVLGMAPRVVDVMLDLAVTAHEGSPPCGAAGEPANAMAACLPLMAALDGGATEVRLALGPTSWLDVRVRRP